MKGKLAELVAAQQTQQQQADVVLAEVNVAKQHVEQIRQQIAAMTAAPIP